MSEGLEPGYEGVPPGVPPEEEMNKKDMKNSLIYAGLILGGISIGILIFFTLLLPRI